MTAVSERSVVDLAGAPPATTTNREDIPRAPGLTVRGVKARLTRAGVDYSALTFSEHDEVSREVDFDGSGPWRRRTVVTIHGSRAARQLADRALFWADNHGRCVGLSCAPYPDRSVWSR